MTPWTPEPTPLAGYFVVALAVGGMWMVQVRRWPARQLLLGIGALALPLLWHPVPYVLVAAAVLAAMVLLAAGAAVGATAATHGPTQHHVLIAVLWASGLCCVIGLFQAWNMESLLPGSWVPHCGAGRSCGPVGQPNHQATLLLLGLAALWAVRPSSRRREWALAMFGGVLVAGTALTGSRTVWVTLPVVCVFAWVWRRGLPAGPRRGLFLTLPLVYLGIWSLIHFRAKALGLDVEDPLARAMAGGGSRLTLWPEVLQVISQSPWSGVGWRGLNHAHFMADLPARSGWALLGHAHNLVLQWAVEFGLPFAGVLVCLLVALAWRAAHVKVASGAEQAFRRMAVLSLIVLGLHAMVEYPLNYPYFLWLAGAYAGICASGLPTLPGLPRPRELRLLGMGMALVAALVARDYAKVAPLYAPAPNRTSEDGVAAMRRAETTWLFAPDVEFALLGMLRDEPRLAPLVREIAGRQVRYVAEARTIEPLILAMVRLREMDDARTLMARYQASFPKEAAAFAAQQSEALSDLSVSPAAP